VYSQVIQLFEIIEYQTTEENDTDIVYSFTCKDNNGDDCTLSIITRKIRIMEVYQYNDESSFIIYSIYNSK
jgi:hypothetical protein